VVVRALRARRKADTATLRAAVTEGDSSLA
jgi:hypothetical protein